MQTRIIIPAILLALFIYALSTVLHELSHILACKILHCRIIGWKVLFIKFDGQHISFNPKGKNHCAFATDNTKKMRIIISAGPITDILVAIICFITSLSMGQKWCKYGLLGATCLILASVIYNLLPMTNGDGKMLFGKDGE